MENLIFFINFKRIPNFFFAKVLFDDFMGPARMILYEYNFMRESSFIVVEYLLI